MATTREVEQSEGNAEASPHSTNNNAIVKVHSNHIIRRHIFFKSNVPFIASVSKNTFSNVREASAA